MKRIILAFCILHSVMAITMDSPRQRSASGRGNSLMVRHQSQSSLGDKVLTSLNLKNDKPQVCSNNIDASVTAPSKVPQESPKSTDPVARSNSRNFTEKAGENNTNNFVKNRQLAFEAIKNIKAENDGAYKEYLIHLKHAEYHYWSGTSLEITKDSRSLEKMADDELQLLRDAFAKKMALIAAQQTR